METMVSVPASLLITLVSITNHHVENVESGLQDGTYKASDNPDLQQLKKDLERLAEQLSGKRPNTVWMTSLPVISTHHLSQETGTVTLAKGFPWLQVAEYETGFYVKVDKYEDHFHEYPEDLRQVMAWATAQKFDWIRIDAEGDDVDGLPIYDW
jgi:hypothetical protein